MDAPIYQRFDTNEGFQAAIDRLLEQINRTQEEIREVQDAFLLMDKLHYVRRPVAQQYRGAIGLGDENEGQALRGRFAEIWAESYPAVSATTVGL